MYDFASISADTGLVTAKIFPSAQQSVIFRATNGGNNWTYTASPSTENAIGKLHRVTDLHWYAVDGRDLIRSTDGGITWSVVSQYSSTPRWVYHMTFPTDSVGDIVFWDPVSCRKTTDAGNTWNSINFSMVDWDSVLTISGGFPTRLFTFIIADTGFACRGSNYIHRTYDGGMTWDSVHVIGAYSSGPPLPVVAHGKWFCDPG
jgi:hypothetical protein